MKDKIYQIDPNVVWKDIDGVIYILQSEKEEIQSLNETGTLIWRLIQKGKSISQMQKSFLASYRVSPDKALKDIQEFIQKHAKERLLILKRT